MKLPGSDHSLQPLSGLWPNLQRRLANRSIPAAAALVISACATPPSEPAPAAARWSGIESSAYRSGHGDGSRDRRQNLPRRPVSSGDYLLGYNDGYQNPHDNPWSQRRARDLGQSHGRGDRLAGLAMDPDRDSGEVPRAVRGDFRSGYQAGWKGAAQ